MGDAPARPVSARHGIARRRHLRGGPQGGRRARALPGVALQRRKTVSVRYSTAAVELDTRDGALRASLRLVNRSGAPWLRAEGFAVGYQIFDPDSQLFIEDGVWQPLDAD